VVMARYFGASSEVDAYVAALALPVVIATILSGSLGYVLVPIVAEQLGERGEHGAAAVAGQIGLDVTIIGLTMSLVVGAAAGPLTHTLCPGFSLAERDLTAELLRVLSALILANSLIAYLNALFHCFRRFVAPAVAGVVGTLVTLSYVVAMHDR